LASGWQTGDQATSVGRPYVRFPPVADIETP
jgi:hypothetical protein